MRWFWAAAAVWTMTLGFCAAARGQDQPNVEELTRKYQDALGQLKAAQDRKNELANENDQLKARLAELEKQVEESRRHEAECAERTYYLRAHHAAWRQFMTRYPLFAERWRAFLSADLLALPSRAPDPLETDILAGERLPRTTDAK
jgi:hypothetical protein